MYIKTPLSICRTYYDNKIMGRGYFSIWIPFFSFHDGKPHIAFPEYLPRGSETVSLSFNAQTTFFFEYYKPSWRFSIALLGFGIMVERFGSQT